MKTLLAALLVAAVASPAMGQDVTINIGGGGGGRSYGPATTRVDLGAYSNGGYARSNSARYSGNDSRESWGSNQRYDHDHHHDHQHDQIVNQGCGLPKCSRRELGLN